MRKIRRSIEKNQRSKKNACRALVALLAAGLVLSDAALPAVAAENPGWETVAGPMLMSSTGTSIDISGCPISEGIIRVEITEDGAYTLTGSNFINEAYVDVRIHVANGVTADLYLDNLNIVNDDGTIDTTTTSGVYDGNSVFIIDGVANVHVTSNSQIYGITDMFSANGTLNFVDSEGAATLKCGFVHNTRSYWNPTMLSGSGEIRFQDAKVTLQNAGVDGTSFNGVALIACNTYVTGVDTNFVGRFKTYEDYTGVCYIYTNRYSLGGICAASGDSGNYPVSDYSNVKNLNGEDLFSIALEGLPVSSDVVKVNNQSVTGLTTDENGHLQEILITNPGYLYFGDNSCYEFWSNIEAVLVDTHTVTFVDSVTGDVISNYTSPNGAYIQFPEEDSNYIYTYTINSVEVSYDNNNDRVYGDVEVVITKTPRPKITITLDGVPNLVDVNTTLADIGATGYVRNVETGELADLNAAIAESSSYETITLQTVTVSNREYFKLNNAADVITFAELVNAGATNINGMLYADVTLDNTFPSIGLFERSEDSFFGEVVADHCYAGFFDGQGHTVNLTLNKPDTMYVGFFGCITAGANIKNLTVTGSVTAKKYAAGIAGASYCKNGSAPEISKCINKANISAENYVAGIVGKQLGTYYGNGTMQINISKCANIGSVTATGSDSALLTAGIVAYFEGGSVYLTDSYNSADAILAPSTYSNANNCFSVRVSGVVGTQKDAEAFLSGEVTYLLNTNAGSTIWYSTVGTSATLPAFSGNTVYAGYANCTDEDLSYANTAFAHTEQGHKDSEIYTYEDGKLVAICEYCGEHMHATLDFSSEEQAANMRGVTVTPDSNWTAKCPDVVIKYSISGNDDYSAEQPTEIGTYNLKAYVGSESNEVEIDDTYTIVAPPVVENPVNDDNNTDPQPGSNAAQQASQSFAEEYNRKVDETIGLIESAKKNGTNGGTVIEFNHAAVPGSVIAALKGVKGVTLHVFAEYEGEKFDFVITNVEDLIIDEKADWYGVRYLKHLFNLQMLNKRIFGSNASKVANAVSSDRTYKIVPHDTLFGIAERCGVSVETLLEKNPSIKSPNLIFAGQTLNY